MIHVKREDFTIEVKGHAGQAEAGKDIVCAAASILIYSLAEELQSHVDRMHELDIDLQSGDATVSAFPKDDFEGICADIFNTVWCGFRHLSYQYPDYIHVEWL